MIFLQFFVFLVQFFMIFIILEKINSNNFIFFFGKFND